jgi:elongation factor Ts
MLKKTYSRNIANKSHLPTDSKEITNSMVLKLRRISGRQIMVCKRVLVETSGDIDKALLLLRSRSQTQPLQLINGIRNGIVVCRKSKDARTIVLATLYCQTDFASRSEPFVATANLLAESVLLCEDSKADRGIQENIAKDMAPQELIADCANKTGEKIEIGNFEKYRLIDSGVIGAYVHFNRKLGSMVKIATSSDQAAVCLRSLANDIAMHITAFNPVAIDEQPGNNNEGNCLVKQVFVRDDNKTVAEVLAETAKKAGGQAKIKRFIRFEIS